MNKAEIFVVLGIEETKNERVIKNAYRQKLSVTNPEDNPEEFKKLRAAYEEACKLAKMPDEEKEQEKDETPSGVWMEKARGIYFNISRRVDLDAWKELFEDDCFVSLEEEENCKNKFLRFMMDYYRFPTAVWKLLDKKLELKNGAVSLREKFPADFIRFIINKCERGEDVTFEQFEGDETADYDGFFQFYDLAWQGLQSNDLEQAAKSIEGADQLGIHHPVMEICRADLLLKQGKGEDAIKILSRELEKYPEDTMLLYNYAELLWKMEGTYRQQSIAIYEKLKAGIDSHYMANLRLAEWYYTQSEFKKAKKCAEKVMLTSADDEFMELLVKINAELEKELIIKVRGDYTAEEGLELCWCYLQDGKISQGIRFALELEYKLTPEKKTEWFGLMSKLYLEQAELQLAVEKSYIWEKALEEKIHKYEEKEALKEKEAVKSENRSSESDPEEKADKEAREHERDYDRLKQAKMIRMQCFHHMGYREEKFWHKAVAEAESILKEYPREISVWMELSQIYTELKEYEKCEDVVNKLVDEYQIYAAYSSSLEANRRQLNPGGVVRYANACIRFFPEYVKAYEYIAKVYLDLNRPEDLQKILQLAKENNIQSAILDAYEYQMTHEVMDYDALNEKIKKFREQFRKPLENGSIGFFEQGLPIINELLYHCPDGYMLVERAIFYRAAHHYEEAKEDFEKALALRPDNSYAYNGLSFVYKYMGDYEKALFCIKKAILYMDETFSRVIYTDMADLYSLLGDFENAKEACLKYEELTKDESAWFINQIAEIYVNLNMPGEACKWFAKKTESGKKVVLENQVDACIKCRDFGNAKAYLKQWQEALLREKKMPRRNLIADIFSPKPLDKRYDIQEMWYYLMVGEKNKVRQCLKRFLCEEYSKSASSLGDCVFAAILTGSDEVGRSIAERIKLWLRKEKQHEKNNYYNREKGHLYLELLANWYTASDQQLQELLLKNENAEICHFCTCPICKELEGVSVLLLLRQGKKQEAKERLQENLYIHPTDEYMNAIFTMEVLNDSRN